MWLVALTMLVVVVAVALKVANNRSAISNPTPTQEVDEGAAILQIL